MAWNKIIQISNKSYESLYHFIVAMGKEYDHGTYLEISNVNIQGTVFNYMIYILDNFSTTQLEEFGGFVTSSMVGGLIYLGKRTLHWDKSLSYPRFTKGTIFYSPNMIIDADVDLSARGYPGAGQNICVFKQEDVSYTIPAGGAAGGAAVWKSAWGGENDGGRWGNAGGAGGKFQTGGGGSGASCSLSGHWLMGWASWSGAGAQGTSYSGGNGGGAGLGGWWGTAASVNQGGTTQNIWYNIYLRLSTQYGERNFDAYPGGTNHDQNPSHGSGGGLVIFIGGDIINNANIKSNGSYWSTGLRWSSDIFHIFGGGSGGGNITILYWGSFTNNGTIAANGGPAAGIWQGCYPYT